MNIKDAYRIKNHMTMGELEYLVGAVGEVPDKTKAIVNIGVYYGASCAALLLGMQKHGITGPLFAIGTFRYHNAGLPKVIPFRERTDVRWGDDLMEQVKSNLAPFADDKEIHLARCFSDDFQLSGINGISFAFVDGDHTTHGCLLDALKYSQAVIHDGIMLFHDWGNFQSVRDAVAHFTSIRTDFRIEHNLESIAVVRKCLAQP